MIILAIDPGSTESGYALIDAETYRPIQAGKAENEEILKKIDNLNVSACAIKVKAYKDMFETCILVGRLIERLSSYLVPYDYVYYNEERIYICNDMNRRIMMQRALADRFAKGQRNFGKGTKKAPGWFYGFSNDAWQAYAVGVTYLDKQRGKIDG